MDFAYDTRAGGLHGLYFHFCFVFWLIGWFLIAGVEKKQFKSSYFIAQKSDITTRSAPSSAEEVIDFTFI